MQTAIYDSKVKLFLKQPTGNIPSTWSWLNAVVRFECENSAIDVIINFLWKMFHKPIVLVVLTTAKFGGFSNFCRYYTRSQTGKSTGYWPTLKSLCSISNCATFSIGRGKKLKKWQYLTIENHVRYKHCVDSDIKVRISKVLSRYQKITFRMETQYSRNLVLLPRL